METIEFRIFEKRHLNCAETLRGFLKYPTTPNEYGKFCEITDLRHYQYDGYSDRITVVVRTNMFQTKEAFIEMLLYKLIMAYKNHSADITELTKLLISAYK